MGKIFKFLFSYFQRILRLTKRIILRLKQQIKKMMLFLPRTLNKGNYGRMAIRDRFEDIRQLTAISNPIIVDAGCHTGSVTAKFLRIFDNPTIHAIEPNPDFASQLRERFGSYENVIVHEKALGSQNRKGNINILNYPLASSILTSTETSKKYHGEKMEISDVLEIEIVRLESIIDHEIDILKMDLQGYELEALKGSENVLHEIKLILLEVEFIPLYENQPLFGDLDVFLRGKGFNFHNFYDLWTHRDGQLTSGDAIYLNSKYYSDEV